MACAREYWKGKAVVVTGAARGQGAAEVHGLLRAGAHVYAVDIHPTEADYWTLLRQEAADGADRLVSLVADVSTEEGWAKVVAAVEAGGISLFGLVNNAGITLRKTVTQTVPQEWDRVLGVNLRGAYLGTHFLAPLMSEGGAIVNISSSAGMTGYFSAAYTASKWGIRGLTKASALDLAARNIRVNTVCPGLVETPMIHAANEVHDAAAAQLFHDANQAATPLDRGGQPQEVADAVLFLLGPESSFINAADVPVDGGMIGAGIYWGVGKATGNL